MTDSSYQSLTKAEDIFKALVWDNLLSVGLAALFTSAPYLSVWPLNSIITSLTFLISNKLFEFLRMTVDLEAIVLVNKAHQDAYNKAFVTLKIISIKHGHDSKEFLTAKENAKIALSRFVRFGAT